MRFVHPGPSWQARMLSVGVSRLARPAIGVWARTSGLRWPLAAVDRLAGLLPAPARTAVRSVRLDRCRAEVIRHDDATGDGVILYLHGGAFLTCGLNTHRRLTAELSRRTGCPVLSVDYRLLPGHPISAAVTDAISGYRWLLDTGHDPDRIVIAGDSAGGYLALMAALATRDLGLRRPAAVVGISPLTDLTMTPAQARDSTRCAFFPYRAADTFMRMVDDAHRHAAVDGETGPLLSPVDEDLGDMPPVQLHVADHELLRPDSESMYARLCDVGVPCEIHVWRGMVHDFPLVGPLLPETRDLLGETARFVAPITGAV